MFPPSGMLAATAAVSNTNAHVSVFSLLGRLLISLFVVLMVLWVLAQIVRRKGMPGSRGHGGRAARRQVDVVARQSIGKGQTLVTVRLDDRIVLLGVTAQNITTLSELDPAAYGILPGSGPGSGTSQVLELEAVTSDAADRPSGTDADADTDADRDPESDSDAPRPLPSTSTSASSASSAAGSMTSTMFSWNQRLDRLRDRTVRR
jgi:flagellar biogenesis protein FliO